MASAQEQLNNQYGGYTGDMSYVESSPMSFDDYWKLHYSSQGYGYGVFKDNPNSFGNWIANIFTGAKTSAQQQYEQYLADYEFNRNQQQAAYATWQQQQREDSAVQRAKEDYMKAGFSPYALIGANYASPSSAVEYGRYKRASDSTDQKKDEDKMLSSALKILALLIFKKM